MPKKLPYQSSEKQTVTSQKNALCDEDNTKEMTEKQKIYQSIKEKRREYYQKNREIINERNKKNYQKTKFKKSMKKAQISYIVGPETDSADSTSQNVVSHKTQHRFEQSPALEVNFTWVLEGVPKHSFDGNALLDGVENPGFASAPIWESVPAPNPETGIDSLMHALSNQIAWSSAQQNWNNQHTPTPETHHRKKASSQSKFINYKAKKQQHPSEEPDTAEIHDAPPSPSRKPSNRFSGAYPNV